MNRIKKIITTVFLGVTLLVVTGCEVKESINKDMSTEGLKEVKYEESQKMDESEEDEQSDIVVATSVAVVEILDKLGVQVQGVPTSSYDLPESTVSATKVGNPMSPDMEIIKSLEPTIVIATDTLGSDYENLFKSNNIPSVFVDLNSIEGLKATVTQLSKRFNKVEKGEVILKEIQEKEDSFKDISEEKELDVMIVFAAPGGVSMLATEESYIGNLVKVAGGNNLAGKSDEPFISYNREALSQMNPDKILVMTHALPDQTIAEFKEVLATDIAWQNIKAVQEGQVEFLDSNYFGMSANLKVIESLEILKEILYPKE